MEIRHREHLIRKKHKSVHDEPDPLMSG